MDLQKRYGMLADAAYGTILKLRELGMDEMAEELYDALVPPEDREDFLTP